MRAILEKCGNIRILDEKVTIRSALADSQLPEIDRMVEAIRKARLAGVTHFMIVVAEGAGSAVDIGKRIHDEIGIDPRVTVLGHIQRGGSPSSRDRETASRMGYHAVMSLVANKGNRVIATQEGRVVDIDMEEALAMTKPFQMDRYDVLEALSLH